MIFFFVGISSTSTLPDIITDEFTAFNGGQPNFACSNILADSQRYNMDTKANTYGKLLLELCKNTGLIIANGRIYQDKQRGSFTYYNRNGKSVIDYMLFDPNCYNMVTDFAVAPKLVESDHCPIEFSLEIEPLCNTHKSVKDYERYMWLCIKLIINISGMYRELTNIKYLYEEMSVII